MGILAVFLIDLFLITKIIGQYKNVPIFQSHGEFQVLKSRWGLN